MEGLGFRIQRRLRVLGFPGLGIWGWRDEAVRDLGFRF